MQTTQIYFYALQQNEIHVSFFPPTYNHIAKFVTTLVMDILKAFCKINKILPPPEY